MNNMKAGTTKATGSVQLARASSYGSSPCVMKLLPPKRWWLSMARADVLKLG